MTSSQAQPHPNPSIPMSTESAAKIYDAESWQDARRPDPLPERLRYDTAARKRDELGAALSAWSGARSGADYDALTERYCAARDRADVLWHRATTAERNRRRLGTLRRALGCDRRYTAHQGQTR